ncbi:hypothetical protein HanIR_Chr15g0777661 [Helianthus annuus]|nr:hypothetical protein HanIR_Chr15g0777661 [Helianthus annuus]
MTSRNHVTLALHRNVKPTPSKLSLFHSDPTTGALAGARWRRRYGGGGGRILRRNQGVPPLNRPLRTRFRPQFLGLSSDDGRNRLRQSLFKNLTAVRSGEAPPPSTGGGERRLQTRQRGDEREREPAVPVLDRRSVHFYGGLRHEPSSFTMMMMMMF